MAFVYQVESGLPSECLGGRYCSRGGICSSYLLALVYPSSGDWKGGVISMKLSKDKQPSRLLRSASRHDAISDVLRAKLKAREKALKVELAEVRTQLKKPDVKVAGKGVVDGNRT